MGVKIIRSDQCPYTVKNVREIVAAAETEFGIQAEVIDLSTRQDAQNSSCLFGTFCILYDGEVIAAHPISKIRFVRILRKRLDQ